MRKARFARASLVVLVLVATAATLLPSAGANGGRAGWFDQEDSARLDANPIKLRGCFTPNGGSTGIAWTWDSQVNRMFARVFGCITLNRLAATTGELVIQFKRSNGSIITTVNETCSKSAGLPFKQCDFVELLNNPSLTMVTLRLRGTNPVTPWSTTTVHATDAPLIDREEAAQVNAEPVRLRGCHHAGGLPGVPNSGRTKVEWSHNTFLVTRVRIYGCITLNRVAATAGELVIQYKRADGSIIVAETVAACSKTAGLPYKECRFDVTKAGLAGLDRITLRLRGTNPATAFANTTVISGRT
jgi:hypothetical protein